MTRIARMGGGVRRLIRGMVALLLYAYAVGECSSRGIERRLREDVALSV
jgi:hypothetical protein